MPLPSVLLHDHLDGGLRPETVIDLAAASGYRGLPFSGMDDLGEWFDQSASGSLEQYLKAFDHTIALMQTAPAIERVAYEAAIDLAKDGVVYAELRFCPVLHTEGGLKPAQVVAAVSRGMELGGDASGLEWGLIIDSLRYRHDALELARIAVSTMGEGVVGFDLAGPEADYPPEEHRAGFEYARERGLSITVHAGESAGSAGVRYMASAIDVLKADRIGHGVEIIQDCLISAGEVVELGPVAERIRDNGIPLEMCPASNVATSRIGEGDHPFGPLFRAGFNVTLNTDNRLISNTSMSREFAFATGPAGLSVEDLAKVTRSALRAAFCANRLKSEVWLKRIAPGFELAGVPLEGELE